MGTQITFRRGSSFPTAGSGITLAEPVFETTLHTFHIGLGHGVTAEWVGAPISGLSADIGAGITYKIPTAASVLNYISGLCFGITNGVRADAANTFTALQSFSSGISASGITVNGNMSVTGNFTVSGGVTFTTSETVLIEDNIITLNSNVTGSPSENAGIEIERGTSANVQLLWNESSDRWTFTNDGSTYYDLPTSVVTSFNGNTGAVTGASLGANTFTGLNTFTAGLCASGATLSGSVRFLGTSSKYISTTQAPLIISGTSSGPIAQATNSIRFGVEQTDPLTITSITGVVNISTDNPTLPLQPALKFNTDDLDIIGSGSIKVEPNGYATGNRTQYLQDANGTLALTSQLMGAVNGSTAATTAVTSFNGRTGAVQGVSSAAAGTGISVSTATGAITITNIGVQSFNGNTGAVTGASLGANTFTGLNSFNAGVSATGLTIGGSEGIEITRRLPAGVLLGEVNFLKGLSAELRVGNISGSEMVFSGRTASVFSPNTSLTIDKGATEGAPTTGDYAAAVRFVTKTGFNAGTATLAPVSGYTTDRTINLPNASGTVALTSQLMGAVNGSTAATTAVTSFNGNTGAVTGASLGANTFTGLNTFTAGLCAAGITVSGDIRFSGTSAKTISSNQATLTIAGVSTSPILVGSNSVVMGVQVTDSLTLNSATSIVDISTTTSGAYPSIPSIRILTDDADTIGPGSIKIIPASYATANRTQYLQDADGTLALTSQLMGAVNGSTAATTAVTSFNGRTGAVQGVSSAAAGTGISVSAATGAVTITNTGVQSFNGNTGAVTGASLGANTFTGLNTFNAGISAAGGVTFSGTIASDTGYTITSNAINSQTGTTYTFLSSDNGKIVTFNNGSTTTVTIPTGLPVGFNCTAIQLGAGQVGFTAASGVTMNAYASVYKISGQHGAAALISYTANIFNLSGTLSA